MIFEIELVITRKSSLIDLRMYFLMGLFLDIIFLSLFIVS